MSSNSATSGAAYTALASDTRCFCPPDIVTPLSPISVWSPAGHICRSGRKQHASRTRSYRPSLNSEPNSMFFRTVSLRMKGI
mmetsp:Transcript_28169/g.81441  ORF Transcript_28169/g.81441 Transcript_28169/m.81441 type:complete len:82 (+) Transcript_28169:2320-2565(+)